MSNVDDRSGSIAVTLSAVEKEELNAFEEREDKFTHPGSNSGLSEVHGPGWGREHSIVAQVQIFGGKNQATLQTGTRRDRGIGGECMIRCETPEGSFVNRVIRADFSSTAESAEVRRGVICDGVKTLRRSVSSAVKSSSWSSSGR